MSQHHAQYARNRVLVDQCTECEGIFLDRGEFERLVEAEKAFYGSPAPVGRPAESRYDERPSDDRRYGAAAGTLPFQNPASRGWGAIYRT